MGFYIFIIEIASLLRHAQDVDIPVDIYKEVREMKTITLSSAAFGDSCRSFALGNSGSNVPSLHRGE